MPSSVRYGIDCMVELDLADSALVGECGVPREDPVADLGKAVAEALSEPIGFPPLGRAIVPGDHVAITLDYGLPHAQELVRGVVDVLLESGIDPCDVTVLRTAAEAEASVGDPCELLPDDVRDRVRLQTHDPADASGLAYLAATESGHRIFLNRTIVDAEVVVPVGCLQSSGVPDYFGLFGSVFPAFSDLNTQLRYRSLEVGARDRDEKQRLTSESAEVGWLLGAAFAIQIVPGPGESVLHVLAGEVRDVGRRGRRLYDAAWRWSVPRKASLVVAAIEGGRAQQTWHNVGRALAAAMPLVDSGGSVAVCCTLGDSPGMAMKSLIGAEVPRKALRRLGDERPEDIVPAVQLVRALERARVYLLSGIDESIVEDLDMVPLSSEAELARLAGQHETCILLSNAPHASVRVRDA